MAEFKNTFIAGRMNKDIDSRLMPEGEYRDALNIKLGSSAGSDIGAIESMLSNQALTTLSLGTVVNTIGAFFDNSSAMVYWFTTSETGDYVIEYDTINNTAAIVLADTSAGVLNFNVNNLITGVGVIVDTDNDKRLLTWTDGLNPIRSINIATAKAYSVNGFNSAQISVVKRPPMSAPTIALTTTTSEEENNLAERFLRFSHRYRYADGEVSAMSPFTETAFLPTIFRYDYSISSNESMVNQYNQATISFNTGVGEVVGIDILVKESLSSTVYLVEAFDKDEESWADNSTQSFIYVNSKTATAIASDQLKRLYDAVPLTAKALEVIGNRLMLGNYTEGYNIVDGAGGKIKIDFTLAVNSTAVSVGAPTQTMKSNRGYEIGIVYMDDDGRMTTVLTCATNTTFVNNIDSDKGNKIQVTIINEPPAWATRYRFFLKQSKINYDSIVPSIFYQDGTYVWLKVEADERNKFNEGDFLYVKSDSSQILTTALQTRVLEITDQVENFLDITIVDTIEQEAGWYFKIKPSGFRLNENDFQTYTFSGTGFRSRATDSNFILVSGASFTYYELPIYYGSVGLNDATITGTYTGIIDVRYIIDISAVGLPDSFRWSNDDGATYSADIPITGVAQTIESGLSVTFGASTGHDLTDEWIVSAKAAEVTNAWNKSGSSDGSAGSLKRRALMAYQGKPVTDETIKAGANITISYDDTGSSSEVAGQLQYTQTFTSGAQYANIEEWFFGDNIVNTLTYPTDLGHVVFRRGYSNVNQVNIDGRYTGLSPNEPMVMVFSSSANYGGSGDVRTLQDLTVLELNNNIIFETIPVNNDESFFYEIGRTYNVTGGYHIGFDGSDTNQTAIANAVLLLPVFNAFSWGNAFESYKIKDRFNENEMLIDTRPSLDIENYRANNRISDITYSKVFEQSTNFNGLNEFNLSTFNFLSMDDRYGSIQKLFSADTNLEVFQEDKIHTVLYGKDVLFDADGQGSIRETTNVLGTTPTPWAGEYGISVHPESFAFYGNMRYWVDVRRGTPLRRSLDGITEINKGMKDFFRDAFRDNPSDRKFGAYDLHNKEYVISDSGNYTVGYDDTLKGYTSFYSFDPQWMGSLNNNFYSFSNGQLYKHYNEANSVRNNFYGVNYDSTVKVIVNQEPSLIKVLKNIMLEGNKAWATVVKSYINDETVSITQSTLLTTEYSNREGKLHAYVRRNEIVGDFSAKNAFGLGEIASVAALVLTMKSEIHSSLSIGDSIYNSSAVIVGTVTAVNRTSKTITLSSVGALATDDFILGLKDGRIEGSEIRGYNFEIDLTDSTNTRTELFAVGTNLFKSNPT
tara:strand:- start:12044 stop:15988 length:3945 start_codon:yes stop_codon:yes gene_type:complete